MAVRADVTDRRPRGRRWAAAVGLVGAMGVGVLTPTAAQAVDPSADLSVSISHAPATVTTLDQVTFTLTGTNAGPDPATDVVLGMSFSYPLDLVSANPGCRLSYTEQTSVLCTVGTIASGASTAATIKVVPHASGIYTIPAAASSPTSDPDTADLTASETMLVRRGPSQAERYVRGVFPIVLDRDPDAGAVTYWTKKFQALNKVYPRRYDLVPYGMTQSNEYRRLRIRQSYLKVLGRAATPQDLAYWVPKAAGGLSYEAIERRLITSKEFSAKHGQDPADPTIAAYQVVLGRAPTQKEIEAFALDYANGKTFASIVLRIQRSAGAYGRIVDATYQLALGHAPTALGRYGATVDLIRGLNPERFLAKLLVSNEVMARFPATDDDYDYDDGGIPIPVEQLKRYDFTQH